MCVVDFNVKWRRYGIKTKTGSPGNTQVNAIVERIHQELGNLVRTYNLKEKYLYDTDPLVGILASCAFALKFVYHRTTGKSPGQLILRPDTGIYPF